MFGERNPETACGMWSTTYIIALSIVVVLVVLGLWFSRKMSHKSVKRVLLVMAIWTIVSEVVKAIFTWVTYGIEDVDFLPLYFCSLFMYCTVFSVVPSKTLNKCGLSFIFFGGIIGAVSFFIYPDACIPNYPIYHFMCLRTMLFHGSMIYTGLLIVITNYYKPTIKDFKYYFIELIIISLLAYTINVIFSKNLMYIQEPLNFDISRNLYDAAPKLYPFIIMLLQIVVPFFLSYLVYILISKLCVKKESQEEYGESAKTIEEKESI